MCENFASLKSSSQPVLFVYLDHIEAFVAAKGLLF